MNIVIVDDKKDIQVLLRRRLKKFGFEMQFADNGKEGIKLAHSLNPDLILMDMHMPVMGGSMAVRTLRNQGYRGMIIALSASVLAEDVNEMKEAGCDGFLSKPIGKDFVQKLNRIMERRLECQGFW